MRPLIVLLAPLVALLDSALTSAGPLSAVVLAGLLGAMTTLVILTVVLAVLVLAGLVPGRPAGAFREVAGTRTLVWQRNPDAAGHVRSRAPGAVLPAV